MDKNKALINILISAISKVILLLISILLRRFLLRNLGNEAVGIYSLFFSLVGFLSIAELGIGVAITYNMYKPIVNGEIDTVSGLFHLYKNIYRSILIISIAIGLIIVPFISNLAKENSGTFNIELSYVIFLIGTFYTYIYAHKTSFINANLDNYINVIIRTISLVIEHSLQIILLIFINNISDSSKFVLFYVIMFISNVLQGILTNVLFNKKYKSKLNGNKHINYKVKSEVIKKSKAMFFHKFGSVVVNTTDNILISSFIGVSILGIFNNYTIIANNLFGVLALIFTSITSIVGHSFAKNSKEVFYKQFEKMYYINFITGFLFFLGFYSVIDEVIFILFSKNTDLILDNKIVIVISLDIFIKFMRQSVLCFRDASGSFYNDRFKPVIEGIVNLIVSIILLKYFGIIGVLIGTIMTNILITHIVEPFVLYKNGFNLSPKRYYFYNYMAIFMFLGALYLFNCISFNAKNIYIRFLVKGFTSVAISFTIYALLFIFNSKFRELTKNLFKEVNSIFKRFFKRKKIQ